MSDNMTETADKESLMGPGARLRIAREATRLSVNDVARYLHLKPEVIHDIENDDYSRAPKAVFLRGYIRSYAKLLSLPSDEMIHSLNRFYQEEEFTEGPSYISKRVPLDEKKIWLRWVAALLGGVLMVFVAVWWHWQKVSLNETKTLAEKPLMVDAKEHKPVVVTAMSDSAQAKQLTEVNDTSSAEDTADSEPQVVSIVKPKHTPVTNEAITQTDEQDTLS